MTAAQRSPRLVGVQAVHTAVFWLELGSIIWLAVSGIVGRRDRTVAVAAALVAAEAVVWLANDRICPLTPLAERYGAASGSVSDIWLPDPVARTIPQWSTALLVLAAVLHLRAARRPTGPVPTHGGRRDPRLTSGASGAKGRGTLSPAEVAEPADAADLNSAARKGV